MTHRALYLIAGDIQRDWQRLNKTFPYAAPYCQAMQRLNQITDDYGADSGRSIVLYFLSNAATWRGDTAKRIKTELKDIVRSTGYKI